MGLGALCIAGLMYVIAAADLARRRDAPMALVFTCYAVANFALAYAGFRADILAMVKAWT